jgi:hypothetical protein
MSSLSSNTDVDAASEDDDLGLTFFFLSLEASGVAGVGSEAATGVELVAAGAPKTSSEVVNRLQINRLSNADKRREWS